MNLDLKIIKKKYGERMSKLCRELFPLLLEEEGLLSETLLNNFEPTHFLYDDIIKMSLKYEFKNYIYSLIKKDVSNINQIVTKTNKTPKELLAKAGYDLYECKTEEEIQSFKKYYKKGEEICTFYDDRLKRCRVFFAVKKNVDKIRREDFKKPLRQDLYGTSVISIQFTKDENHNLLITNRYNHMVNNPDATFSNNLDNIVPGLTDSFEREYGLVQKYKNHDFDMEGYVKAEDGKYYKYNYEINNIYYCPDNIIIDNTEIKRYDKEKYIVLDYFILDLVNKKISMYENYVYDSFIDDIQNIDTIYVKNLSGNKLILINTKDGKQIKIIIDKKNRIIKYKNDSLKELDDNFLWCNESLIDLQLPNVTKIGDDALYFNESLTQLNLPKLQSIGDSFMSHNAVLKTLNMPEIITIGEAFLYENNSIKELYLPNLIEVGATFLCQNNEIEYLNLPKLMIVQNMFLFSNKKLRKLNLPNLRETTHYFLFKNELIDEVNLPELKIVGDSFLFSNNSLKKLELPNLKIIGDSFLCKNQVLLDLKIPKLEIKGIHYLEDNMNFNIEKNDVITQTR